MNLHPHQVGVELGPAQRRRGQRAAVPVGRPGDLTDRIDNPRCDDGLTPGPVGPRGDLQPCSRSIRQSDSTAWPSASWCR